MTLTLSEWLMAFAIVMTILTIALPILAVIAVALIIKLIIEWRRSRYGK